MTEREQIIEGLLDFVADLSPFAGDHEDWMKVHRAIKYLNEGVKPKEVKMYPRDQYACGFCGHVSVGSKDYHAKYCPECGRAVKWDEPYAVE